MVPGNYYVMTITNPATDDQLNPFKRNTFFNHPFVQNGGINPQDYVSGGQFAEHCAKTCHSHSILQKLPIKTSCRYIKICLIL